jgi:hypothetical protein
MAGWRGVIRRSQCQGSLYNSIHLGRGSRSPKVCHKGGTLSMYSTGTARTERVHTHAVEREVVGGSEGIGVGIGMAIMREIDRGGKASGEAFYVPCSAWFWSCRMCRRARS